MKKIISICFCVMLLASLVGCGSSDTTTVGTTKADTTSTAVQVVNELAETSVESIEEVSNSSSESVSNGSGKYEDYWEGDGYFDIVGFAEANGSVYTMWIDKEGNATDPNQAVYCTFYFKDAWRVSVYDDFLSIINNDSLKNHLIVFVKNGSEYISVCKENDNKCQEEVLNAFNVVVECLKTSSDKEDPFEGSGLRY